MIQASQTNRRVLVIDDNKSIHEDFRKILPSGSSTTADFDGADELLFGSTGTDPLPEPFEVDSAFQGQEGLSLVEKSMMNQRPYAVAFVDVRMPPGWDGIETIQNLWKCCPDLQTVICTACSDYSWSEIVEKLGQNDNLLIIKKPFDKIEVIQLASALIEKWKLTQQVRAQVDGLQHLVQEQVQDVATAHKVAVQALQSFSDGWTSLEIHAAQRVLELLECKARNSSQKPSPLRKNTRSAYQTIVTAFLPNPQGDQQPLLRVLCRNISIGGLSFLYRSQISNQEVVAFLTMKGKPVWFHGRIVRSKQVADKFWEHGVVFTRRSISKPTGAPEAVSLQNA